MMLRSFEVNVNLPDKVIFFDGYCVLCNKFVDFITRNERPSVFKFCPLQSEIAKLGLIESGYTLRSLQKVDNVVYLRHGELKIKSDAVLSILVDMGGILKSAVLLYAIPRYIRDKVYDACAKRRYGWFGKNKVCRIVEPEKMIKFFG